MAGPGGVGGLGGLFNDPELLTAFQDPEVANAFQDIMSNPANMSKYQGNPKVMNILTKLTSKLGGGGGGAGFPGMGGGFPGMGGGFPGMGGGFPGMGGFGGGAALPTTRPQAPLGHRRPGLRDPGLQDCSFIEPQDPGTHCSFFDSEFQEEKNSETLESSE